MAIENHRLTEARLRAERLAAVGEAVAYLSHHIRNILQGLRGGADLVEMGLKRGKQEMISGGWLTVDNNLNRILHLTTNMLTFSKNREPMISMTQVNALVQDAFALARRQAEEHGVELTESCDDVPPVPADPEGIHQAVLNLMLNAISACPMEGGKVHVRTRFDQVRGRVIVSVSDNGGGMSKDQLKHIFQPFYSSKGQGGTGLGLAATKKIVDELHGEIIVESAPGKGSCFEIRLPAERSITRDLDQTYGPAK
jgi:signal transduction histidine kinase